MRMIKKEMKKEIPVLVKIMSIFDYIYGGLLSLYGLLFLGLGAAAFSIIEYLVVSPESAELSSISLSLGTIVLIGGILVLCLGILLIFTGVGLWKGRNWARISQIVLSFVAITFLIIISIINFVVFKIISPEVVIGTIMGGGVNIIVLGAIAFYLLLNKKVKEVFS